MLSNCDWRIRGGSGRCKTHTVELMKAVRLSECGAKGG